MNGCWQTDSQVFFSHSLVPYLVLLDRRNDAVNDVPIPNPIEAVKLREQAETAAYNQIFNEVLGGHPPEWLDFARPAFRAVFSSNEFMADQSEATESFFRRDRALEQARDLEKEADKYIAGGHLEAAEHLLRRDLRFSIQTLGLDDQWSKRLAAEVKVIDQFLKVPPLEI